jgi:hypothetical protein
MIELKTSGTISRSVSSREYSAALRCDSTPFLEKLLDLWLLGSGFSSFRSSVKNTADGTRRDF